MNKVKINKIFNMKTYVITFGFILIQICQLLGQKQEPVTWTFDVKKLNDSEYEITATADINKGWTLYSQFTDDNGPVPTSFVIGTETVSFEEKSKVIKEFDPLFDVNVMKFKEKAIFVYKLKKPQTEKVTGYVTFMTCDGEKCLPPADKEFALKL
jgi:thiol:disulfide interchange protein DsbD